MNHRQQDRDHAGRFVPLPVVLLAFLVSAAPRAHAGGKVEFNRDIRPILSDNCFYCHGPDKNHRKAKLRLDDRAAAIAKGAVVPGKPEESELIARVVTAEASELMPPPATHKKLSAAQKNLLKRWIAEGAEYQAHWAYVSPRRPAVPAVQQKAWVANPIDAFVLRGLEARRIKPAPAADRRTLLRRLSLDLIGLPPTPEEVEAFVADRAPRAYERQVDRLLASYHFGERMAVPWLDLVRFADTVGYHGDQNQNIFPYRDYVIDAFNTNKPFDQFTLEQLAGDLLPNPTVEQLVATGFNRLNMVTREGGAQPKEYLAKYAADRVRTVSMAWLGSTMGCAECHDHKFDPFTTQDFYAMEAFFADIQQWGVYADYSYTPNPDLKGWSNDHPFPPEIEVASPYLQRRQERLRGEIGRLGTATRFTPNAFDDWSKASLAFLQQAPGGWVTPAATMATRSGSGGGLVPQADGSFLLTGKAQKGEAESFLLQPAPARVAALRLEVLPHVTHKGSITRDRADSALVQLSAAVKSAQTGRQTPLTFSHADADHKEPRYAGGSARIDILDGWKTSSKHKQARQTSVWLLDPPRALAAGDQLLVTVTTSNLGCVRLAVSPFGRDDPRTEVAPALRAALTTAPEARTAGQNELLRLTYLLSTGADAETFARIKALLAEVYACRDGRAMTMVTQAWAPRPIRLLPRGNWQDESGPLVLPAVPHFLPQLANPDGRRLTRLDLAQWLVAAENPLTARVFVNRLWKQYFGSGLSALMEDVGAQGEWPSHPELLDWLAVEFRERGWDVKHLVKLLVMSAAYRQEAGPRPELRELDPTNRLLAAQSPRRLQAEFVRDNALAIAGLLNRDQGGPSVRPYQPPGYYANLQFPDRRYGAHTDERQYRRGVYMHWQRTFLHPMLANFDAASREECTANRTVANTPQQALTLLNDPCFVEAACVLAQKLLAAPAGSDGERLDRLYQRALARPAKAAEKQSLTSFLAVQRDYYRAHPDDARKLLRANLAPRADGVPEPELAAWTHVCRVVLNLHETMTRY